MNSRFLKRQEHSFESSPLLGGNSIASAFDSYCTTWRENFFQMHRNEEELNKMFIEIYGLEAEMDEKVELKDITLLKKEADIVDGELVFNREEITKQFLSYVVGVIMGRYSLDKPGLVMANSDDKLVVSENYYLVAGEDGEVRHKIENPRYVHDRDGIVLLNEISLIEEIEKVMVAIYGRENHFSNLEFLAQSLGMKKDESSRDVLQKYMVNEFMKDHMKRYQKRPIYWLFTSGKNKAFNGLIYMHRYNQMTVPTLRTDYLLKYQERQDIILRSMEKELDSEVNPKAKKELEKKIKALDAQVEEMKAYDSEVKNMAEKRLVLDLDDGVKVNYEKFGKLLYKI